MRALLPWLRLTGRNWRGLALAMALALATLLAGAALLGLSGWFIVGTALAGSLAAFNVFTPSAGIRTLTLVRTAARWGERMASHDATFRILARLRGWFFARMAALLPVQRGFEKGGDLLNRVTADIDALDGMYLRSVTPLTMVALSLLLLAAMLAWTGAAPVWLALAASIASVGVPWLVYIRAKAGGRAQADSTAALRIALVEGVQGAKELAVFGGAAAAADRALRESDALVAASRDVSAAGAAGAAGAALTARALAAVVLTLGLGAVAEGQVAVGMAALAVFATLGLMESLGLLSQAAQGLARTVRAAERLNAATAAVPPIAEPAVPRPVPERPDLTVADLTLRYAPGAPAVLSGLSLDVPYGGHVGLLGPSGQGKSTLAQALLKLLPAERGTVTLGGVPLADLSATDVRRTIAYLPQAPYLFDGTVRENLLLAVPEATEEALWAALDGAGLADAVEAMPEGLDTWVGEGGLRFSGGEAKRVGLAQILLRRAPITILDEPTVGLDRATAGPVLDRLHAALRDRSLIVISHVPEDLRHCGTVWRLERGRLLRP